MKDYSDPEMLERIERDFRYHPPHTDQPDRYELLRAHAREFAKAIVILCPPTRERSTALTRLEEAVMHSNAAIARNERDPST